MNSLLSRSDSFLGYLKLETLCSPFEREWLDAWMCKVEVPTGVKDLKKIVRT